MPACPRCPGRVFKDNTALKQHQDSGRHTSFSCSQCDKVLQSEKALQQHAQAKHVVYECQYCDRSFTTDGGRSSHENAKHAYNCEYCDRKFTTHEGLLSHQKAKHPTFGCHACERTFNSQEARQQHENTKHNFSGFCTKTYIREDWLRWHVQSDHIRCRYCANMVGTQSFVDAHEQSCAYNFATKVKRPITPDHPTTMFSSLSSKKQKTMETEEGSSTSAAVPHADNAPESPASSPHLLYPTMNEGEMFHSTNAIAGGSVIGEPYAPVRPHEPSTCLGSERTFPSPNTDEHLPDDVEYAVSANVSCQGHSAEFRDIIFTCAACLDVFSTEETYRGHICAYRTAMLTPHCTICYSQFDDESLLLQHLEGLEAFSCQFCQTRCCSEEMMQDHLLSHPTCAKCGESFADNLTLCAHVESDHPVVACWDCDGVVVEKDNLGLHYTESPAHPSCAFCGVGTKNPEAMDEHVRHLHSSFAEIPIQLEGGDGGPDEASPIMENAPPQDQDASGPPSEQPDSVPPPPVMEPIVPLGGPCDEAHNSLSRTESSLFLSPQPTMPAQVEHISNSTKEPCIVNGEVSLHVDGCQYGSPSPTPSEHGGDVIQVQVPAINNDARPSSPVSTLSADSSLSDTNQTTSSHSIVFVSANELPDYIRENRAVLVATSAGSPSSGRTPLRLPSSSSLESLDMVQWIQRTQARCEERPTNAGDVARPAHRLHCRICLKDPCEEMTATICGHLFCKRCITEAVLAKSECPVCKSATLLYCLLKLDLSV